MLMSCSPNQVMVKIIVFARAIKILISSDLILMKFWSRLVLFGSLLDQVVSVLLVLMCIQYSNSMQIDPLTFQQGS
jgi:hypothetical protein